MPVEILMGSPAVGAPFNWPQSMPVRLPPELLVLAPFLEPWPPSHGAPLPRFFAGSLAYRVPSIVPPPQPNIDDVHGPLKLEPSDEIVVLTLVRQGLPVGKF